MSGGGGKRSLYEHMKWLSKRHELDLYHFRQTKEGDLDVRGFCKDVYEYSIDEISGSAGLKTERMMAVVNARRLLPIYKKIASDIDARGYNLLYSHTCKYTKAPPLLMLSKTPKVYYCHEPPRDLHEHSPSGKGQNEPGSRACNGAV